MKGFLYVVVISIGIAIALSVSTIWFELFLKLFFIPTEDPVNILVLGIDKDIGGTRRTDVIFIASIDLSSKKILISSIPRDLIIDGKKINSYFQKEGIDLFKKRIEELTGVKITRHIIVDYDIFEYLGDELGPIDIFVDRPMYYKDTAQNLEINFSPGYYKMKGKELLAYLRFRKTAEGDIGRLDKQRIILEKLAQKAIKKDIFSLTAIYREIRKKTDINLELGEAVYIFSRIKNEYKIDTVSFPFYIAQDGNLYVDNEKLDKYKESFTTGEKKIQEQYRFYVINNSNTRNEKIGKYLEEKFEKAGFKPSNIFYEGVDVEFKKNTVLLLRKNEGLRDYILNILNSTFPNNEFEIIFVDDRVDFVSKYLSIIGELTKKGKKIRFPIDFIIVVKEI